MKKYIIEERYVARNGKEFDTKEECEVYENKLFELENFIKENNISILEMNDVTYKLYLPTKEAIKKMIEYVPTYAHNAIYGKEYAYNDWEDDVITVYISVDWEVEEKGNVVYDALVLQVGSSLRESIFDNSLELEKVTEVIELRKESLQEARNKVKER